MKFDHSIYPLSLSLSSPVKYISKIQLISWKKPDNNHKNLGKIEREKFYINRSTSWSNHLKYVNIYIYSFPRLTSRKRWRTTFRSIWVSIELREIIVLLQIWIFRYRVNCEIEFLPSFLSIFDRSSLRKRKLAVKQVHRSPLSSSNTLLFLASSGKGGGAFILISFLFLTFRLVIQTSNSSWKRWLQTRATLVRRRRRRREGTRVAISRLFFVHPNRCIDTASEGERERDKWFSMRFTVWNYFRIQNDENVRPCFLGSIDTIKWFFLSSRTSLTRFFEIEFLFFY